MQKRMIIWICCVCLPLIVNATQLFLPFPKASDEYWRKEVPAKMRKDYVRLGNLYKAKSWDAIPDSLFAEFRTNGNRTNYEAQCFNIRTQFACLVMAEIMEHKGHFMLPICQGLHYFMEKEQWWGIPAHYPKAKSERSIQPVDLFNAETSSMLAWTLYMLGDEIDRKEPGLCENMRGEIERRFLNPTLYEKQGWKYNANNWNTWITSNWLETALICERDTAKLAAVIKGVHADLRLFLKGYPDDGACEEGVAYWDRAGASFFESLYFLDACAKTGFVPDSRLILTKREQEKVHRMGQFLPNMHIHNLNFVNYSDAPSHHVPNINILFPFGAYEKDEQMMQFAAYIGMKHSYLTNPSVSFLMSGNFPTLGRELLLLSMLPEYQKVVPVAPKTEDAYLANSQIFVASNNDWFVSMKGGNNAESHNHNDIGNFVVYYRNHPVIIDLGRDTYTSKSFSSQRFELMNCRSAYHNVPIVNGFEQKDGGQYRAINAMHIREQQEKGMVYGVQMDIQKAYPEEAQVKTWNRQLTLDCVKDEVSVQEIFSFAGPKSKTVTELVLMCYGKPCLDQDGRVLLADGMVRLSIPKSLFTVDWEKVNMQDGIMKEQWRDNIYRLKIKFGEYAYDGEIKYVFSCSK